MRETPNLRWFEQHSQCGMCGKASAGILRGSQSESYGQHCKKCAEKRLKASEKERQQVSPLPSGSASHPDSHRGGEDE